MQKIEKILVAAQSVISIAFIMAHISINPEFERLAQGWAALGNQRAENQNTGIGLTEVILYISALIPIAIVGRREEWIRIILKVMSIGAFVISFSWLALSAFLWGFGLNPTTPAFILLSAIIWTMAVKNKNKHIQSVHTTPASAPR